MIKFSKKFFTVILILISVAIIYSIKSYLGSSRIEISRGPEPRVKGDANAPVGIIEFIDFQCGICAKGSKFLKEFMQEHPQLIRLELKYFPLYTHKHSFLASRYCECASRQGRFWSFHDELVKTRDHWEKLIDAQPTFDHIAQKVSLNAGSLKECLQDQSVDDAIWNNKAEGKILGVKRTPTYFVNGDMVVGLEQLEITLNKILAGQYKNKTPSGDEKQN